MNSLGSEDSSAIGMKKTVLQSTVLAFGICTHSPISIFMLSRSILGTTADLRKTSSDAYALGPALIDVSIYSINRSEAS